MAFRDIVGHRRLIDRLARAAARGSLPPSLIFAGPRGVGKHRAAVALAQFLNCQERAAAGGEAAGAGPAARRETSADACGDCPACRRIARGVHSDVPVLEPDDAGSIKVDQVREMIDRAAYRPFEGRRRVVIVDDAHTLAAAGQSALLKTLEEPPSGSLFVLITDRPDALMPTVRSRCPVLRFGGLDADEVAGLLVRDHGLDMGEAKAAAAAAGGSVGVALERRGRSAAAARVVAHELLEALADGGGPRERLETAKTLAGRSGPPVVEREQLTVKLQALSSLIRDLEVLATRADERWLANTDEAPRLRGLVGRYDRRRLVGAFSAVGTALLALERNASPKIVADWLVFQF